MKEKEIRWYFFFFLYIWCKLLEFFIFIWMDMFMLNWKRRKMKNKKQKWWKKTDRKILGSFIASSFTEMSRKWIRCCMWNIWIYYSKYFHFFPLPSIHTFYVTFRVSSDLICSLTRMCWFWLSFSYTNCNY